MYGFSLSFGFALSLSLSFGMFSMAGDGKTSKTKKTMTPWAKARHPSKGKAEAIGSYSSGCVQGAVRLPEQGEGFQLMKPQRRRMYGHPSLVRYIKNISKKLRKKKAGPILVGDLGQPMGGPSPHGHASHQSGLDVDLWLWHPKEAEERSLTKKERRSMTALDVVNRKTKKFSTAWSEKTVTFLNVAASEKNVSRIFVNPLIKERLCELGTLSTASLQKIRPWYGHIDHMHVRLYCPTNSPDCKNQNKLPAGDGCNELDWWFDQKAQMARKKARAKYQKKVGATPQLHKKCDALITP